MLAPRVLIVDKMHESISPLLEAIGLQPDYQPNIKKEEIPGALKDAIGMVVRSKVFVDENLLQPAQSLRFVARAGAGVDNVDTQFLEQRNISLINAPEGNRDALAEHAMGMLLALFNRLIWADREVRNGIWDREGNRGYELMHRTVGIFGYGYMGQALAKRLSSFGCRVIAYDKYKQGFGDEYAEEVTLDTLFAETEVLSLNVPLTEETRFLADNAFFSQFKKPFHFLNTSRGEVASLGSLVQHMKEGKILGAALDVLENEKLDTLSEEQKAAMEYLTQSENTILSPHVAGWSFESYEKINQTLVKKIQLLGLI